MLQTLILSCLKTPRESWLDCQIRTLSRQMEEAKQRINLNSNRVSFKEKDGKRPSERGKNETEATRQSEEEGDEEGEEEEEEEMTATEPGKIAETGEVHQDQSGTAKGTKSKKNLLSQVSKSKKRLLKEEDGRGDEGKAHLATHEEAAPDIDAKTAVIVKKKCANGTSCPLAKVESGKRKQRFLKCGKCRQASYCSVECQHSHWPKHRVECKDCTIGQLCSTSTLHAEVAVGGV